MTAATVVTSPDAARLAAARAKQADELDQIHQAACRWCRQSLACSIGADLHEIAERARRRAELSRAPMSPRSSDDTEAPAR